MPGTSAISPLDLSQLPAPVVVEQIDYEAILAAMLAQLRALDPTFDALVESDPAYKILEVAAYRELLIRAEFNDGCRSLLLAYAQGADLDHIGATWGVARLVLVEADPEANPPVAEVLESDDDFRKRIQLSPEGYTTAGSTGSYIFHGLGASAEVKDVEATSPAPGAVTIHVLSREGDGTADAALLAAVDAALSADTVRPLTDQVSVVSADVTTFDLVAELVMFPGPDAELVRARAEDAVTAYLEKVHKIGYDVTRSGLFAALHQDGVQRVTLTSPTADLVAGEGEAYFAQSVTVTVASDTDV